MVPDSFRRTEGVFAESDRGSPISRSSRFTTALRWYSNGGFNEGVRASSAPPCPVSVTRSQVDLIFKIGFRGFLVLQHSGM
jgi:hypothetical protein